MQLINTIITDTNKTLTVWLRNFHFYNCTLSLLRLLNNIPDYTMKEYINSQTLIDMYCTKTPSETSY